jgi:pilus assembly protein CpaB
VFKAQEQGSIQLALRNPTDRTLLEKPETIASMTVPPMPRANTPRGKTFTVIRGMSQSKIQCKGYVCSEQHL